MNDRIVFRLTELLGNDKVKIDELMAGHTTFKVGGPADVFIMPSTIEELVASMKIIKEEKSPYFLLGNGSNLLVSDEGFRGVVVQIYKNYDAIVCDSDNELLIAQAGALMSKVARTALDLSMTGMECLSGIPGTIGGAIVMNAGAYGSEMKMVTKSVKMLDLDDLSIITKDCEDMDFGYRTSIVKSHPYLVLEVTLKLSKGNKDEIEALMNETKNKRVDKQPLNYPSAGSTFKRPEGYFAGKLIEDSGLKGYSVGGAQVSEKHCGFVINKGDATANDIMTLIGDVQKTVYDKYGVMLEMEVLKLGNI